MPIVDEARDNLVVRLVYDGAPLSGKTTTLRTLARGLGVEVTTPEEHEGRTLFFDWAEYVGGLFDGRQIRCQIVSVPGQRELAERRRTLVESADALIFVADTRAPELPETLRELQALLEWSRRQDPPIGVVFQANKRDAFNRVPTSTLRSQLGEVAPTTAMVETVATSGDGVRATFLFAVRLALDRVKALAGRGELEFGAPEVDEPRSLLARLREPGAPRVALGVNEGGGWHVVSSEPPSEPLVRPAPSDAETSPSEPSSAPIVDEEPFVPDPMMPGGFIWPPVDGRALLHEVEKLGLSPERTPNGDLRATGGGWRFHSGLDDLFRDADTGRRALIEAARVHASNVRRLSVGRALILAEAGRGRYRLWQLIRVHAPLREELVSHARATPKETATSLIDAAERLLRARRSLHDARLPLAVTLWTVGSERSQFVSLVTGRTLVDEELDGYPLIRREFVPLFAHLKRERVDYNAVLRAVVESKSGGGSRDRAVDFLVRAIADSS